jgi:hypothetical protein
VYDVNIRGGRASLVPRDPAAVAAINTIPTPPSTPVPTFNLTEEQMKIGVMVATMLLVLGVLN